MVPFTSLKRYLPNRLRHEVRMLANAEYRRRQHEVKRLKKLPRYRATQTDLTGTPCRLVDAASFLSAYRQIFENEIYAFRAQSEKPLILDCGANVGLAIFYWKKHYPAARITAFEPDADVFEALQWNCRQHGFSDVKLVNSAVWSRQGELEFWQEGADAGHVVSREHASEKEVSKVSAVRLRDYLQEPVDFLKLDIEGAEAEVLIDCMDRLDQVRHLFVEYHSFTGREQRVDEILRVLREAGLRIHIQPELVSPKPFVRQLNNAGMDQRLNIFAYRS